MKIQTNWIGVDTAAIALMLTLFAGCAAGEDERAVAARAAQQDAARTAGAPVKPAGSGEGVSTADLEQRIASAFPGWHLSTEAEILTRTRNLNQDFPPEDLWGDRMRPGQLWWVWPGDFDGDGRQDLVTIASNRADPSQDKAVAFHADGSHAEVAELGGQGVEVIRKGEDWGGVKLPTDAILLEYWEKAKEAVRWYPETRTYGGAEVADDWETT